MLTDTDWKIQLCIVFITTKEMGKNDYMAFLTNKILD